MDLLIKGMEMPLTGLYFVSVDNTQGRDKTVVTVERMLGNRDMRQTIGTYEIVPVPDHGRLIDASKRVNVQLYNDETEDYQTVNMSIDDLLDASWIELEDDPTIIPATEAKDDA